MSSPNLALSDLIKRNAKAAGFDFVGIAKADFLEQEAPRLEDWLKKGYHGEMHYMGNYFDKRLDPRLLMDGAKSVITLLKNYAAPPAQPANAPKIARYAYGLDYHEVIKQQLYQLLEEINATHAAIASRVFVDSAPVLERAWAQKSGLGWIGNNAMLINPKAGSYYFIAVILMDVELPYDEPINKDYCGTCTRCIDACPTDAILGNKVVDGSKCISYFTIELKAAFTADTPKWNDWIFGCDICQEVCPWNRFAQANTEEKFKPLTPITTFDKQQWEELTETAFKYYFKHSPISRTKWKGLNRSILALQNNTNL